MNASSLPVRPARVGGSTSVVVQGPDATGVTRMHSPEPLLPFAPRITDELERWARDTPNYTLVAQRVLQADGSRGDWQRISYAAMLDRARALGQALVNARLSLDRPLIILSGNSLAHLSLTLGCMWVGVPYVPVSTAYSLVSKDFGKLKHIVAKVTPGAVFAEDASYAAAIAATLSDEVVLIWGSAQAQAAAHAAYPVLAQRPNLVFDTLLATQAAASGAQAHAGVTTDTIVKFLFTSGSTKAPKGVITTHRMISANQQMARQCLAFITDEPPVLVDWLPWNHVFGGTHNVCIALFNGGTLYIDDGKPTADGIAETLRNLREISPTIYFNVPKGLEEIAHAMDQDTALRDRLFARCQAFMFAGAGLSQAVWNKLDQHGVAAIGQRIRVITGLGMTEAAPSCTFAVGPDVASGHIGLPIPGVQAKLVPAAGKLEIRFKGPNLMPGYWREPEQSREAFDDEGFYCTGDAAQWIDPKDPQQGLRFDGRIAEDFKLATGTFVSVGPLRARIIAAGAPYVQDVVVAGLNRNELAVLVFPRVDTCCQLAQLTPQTPLAQVLAHRAVATWFGQLAQSQLAQATGSANRVKRWHLLQAPPSIDRGEVTDKGSINQRAVLAHRAELIDALYDDLEAPALREAGGVTALV